MKIPKLSKANFYLMNSKTEGHLLIVDALPHVKPKGIMETRENEIVAEQLIKRLADSQKILHLAKDWADIKKDKKDIPTEDYLLIREVRKILGDHND